MTASILAQSVRRYCNVLKAMFLNKILLHEKKNSDFIYFIVSIRLTFCKFLPFE